MVHDHYPVAHSRSSDSEDDDYHYDYHHDDEDSENSSSDTQNHHETFVFPGGSLPLPREHSYLWRGSSQPLYSLRTSMEDDPRLGATATATDPPMIPKPPREMELPILPLDYLILSPGSTLPVRLHDDCMIRYLRPKMEACRRFNPNHPQYHHRHPPSYNNERNRQSKNDNSHHRRRAGQDTDTEGGDSTMPPPFEGVRIGILPWMTSRHYHSICRPSQGQIGTIATIQYTHDSDDRNDNDDLSSDRRRRNASELVFTVIGKGRFECIEGISEDPLVWKVRDLGDDIPMVRPPMMIPHPRLWSSGPSWSTGINDRSDGNGSDDDSDEDDDDDDDDYEPRSTRRRLSGRPRRTRLDQTSSLIPRKNRMRKHDQMAWNLSLLTPTPHIVYQKYLPWKIVDELITMLRSNQEWIPTSHLDLDVDLPNNRWSSPMIFSFHLADNLSFSLNERLELYELRSTIERLLTLKQKVKELIDKSRQSPDLYLQCILCAYPLCHRRDVFTFDGAEGATSNYVNAHGYNHQVTTIRNVIHRRCIFLEGGPCTENSYFPGYSWTVARCNGCRSLLGWKFQRVSSSSEAHNADSSSFRRRQFHNNCPDTFFGFQSFSMKCSEVRSLL